MRVQIDRLKCNEASSLAGGSGPATNLVQFLWHNWVTFGYRKGADCMKKALVLMMAAALAATSAFAQAGGGAAGGGAAGGGVAGGGASGGGTTGGSIGGIGGGTSGGVGTGTSRTPSTNNGTQGNTSQQPSAIDFPRTIFLSGKVMMDDGSPVPPNVTIQRVCTGTPQSVAYTDSKGHFSFQWGQSNGMMVDASQSSGGGFGGMSGSRGSSGSMTGSSSGPSMAGCELRA